MDFYVSNLAPETTREELQKAFQAHGDVASATLLTTGMTGGRRTGSSRGIAFVSMPDAAQARAALAALQHRELRGRALSVEIARPLPVRRHRR